MLIDSFNKFYSFLDTIPNVVIPERTEVNALQTDVWCYYNLKKGKKSFSKNEKFDAINVDFDGDELVFLDCCPYLSREIPPL